MLKILINLIEKVTNTTIKIKKNQKKIGSKISSQYLGRLVVHLERLCSFKPNNVFEIGANYGQDAEFLRQIFLLENKDVYIFEPHPEIIKEVKKTFSFNSYPYAVSDKNMKSIFHAIKLNAGNSGISSLMKHKYNDDKDYYDIEVETIRMDSFISANKIKEIDFLKVDVEGASFEVLIGFGEELKRVKAIQIEAEYLPVWSGQKTWYNISNLLSNNGFQLVDFILQEDGIQSDSFWIQRKYIRHGIYNISTKKWHKTD